MCRFFVLFIALLLTFHQNSAQDNKRGNVWYFGYNAGIDFSATTPRALSDGKLFQREGCASICDEKGKLVLYTDGLQIWNNQHKVISADIQMGGDESSTQSAIIIPKPGNPNIYYVFSTFSELVCITVDITLNKGIGGIVDRTVLIPNSTEKLAAVRHCNGKDFWIVGHELGNNIFRAYQITADGIQKSYIRSKIGSSLDLNKSVGTLKVSPTGRRMAMAIFGKSKYELFDFDNASGTISNGVTLEHPEFRWAYGVEFSPDEHFLYVCETVTLLSPIFQMDISDPNPAKILSSKVEIGRPPESYYGALQLGPDNKIYVTRHGSKFLGVIHEPNMKGYNAKYINDGFRLSTGTSGMGLPNLISAVAYEKSSVSLTHKKDCNNVTLTANVLPANSTVVYEWYKGDSLITGQNTAVYKPISSGSYSVTVTNARCSEPPVHSENIDVEVLEVIPSVQKLECGLIELSASANARIRWSGQGISESDNALEKVTLEGSGVQTFKIRVFDEADSTCFVEKKINADFGICDAKLLIPDIFTPNNDGINEVFKINVVGGEGIALNIYNRWGTSIFVNADRDPQWNGKTNGIDAPIGVYTYLFKYKSSKGHEFTRRGTLILQR